MEIHLKKRGHLGKSVDVISLLKETGGYSGADIESIVKETVEKAFISDDKTVTIEKLLQTIRTTKSISVTLKKNRGFGENKDDGESFFKEYNIKLKMLYDKFYTEEAREIANKHKEYAQLFYDKLYNQITSAYNSKEKLNKYFNKCHFLRPRNLEIVLHFEIPQ
ncbi:hypothetical protein FACS1894172_05930 [Spirochaetia bacterium]|nr:hypothetical protein FACS1894164_15310 [Spirochaetia bacterium]GHU31277.1 hypothetical protein FACS1894172_05930 [Spirochaetia bacterium]